MKVIKKTIMENQFKNDAQNARIQANAQVQSNWPTTKAPKQYTQYPISSPNTNPPLVIPMVDNPPKAPPIMVPSAEDDDVRAVSGTGNNADFRTDLSQYNLVVVKAKDVPNTPGYNPQSKLKYYPSGKLPGSNETFYLVTHAFADKSNINEIHRGYINIKSDAMGRPYYPLMAYINNLGLPLHEHKNDTRKKENLASGSTLSYVNMGLLTLLIIVVLMVLYNLRKRKY